MAKGESIRKLTPHTRMLSCKLTEKELLVYGRDLAHIREDIQTEEARQVSMKQELKSTLTALEAQSTTLSSRIGRGEEMRDVTVDPLLDFKAGVYYEVRSDTGEKISEREITEDERQENLNLGKKATAGAKVN